jgi:zinc/manganese transport system permease protein
MNFDGLNWSILGPAFAAGLMVLSLSVPLGQRVLERGIIFIDLAIAQIAGVGVIFAHLWQEDLHSWQIQAIALTTALFGAFVFHWVEKRMPDKQEALIGVGFVLAATLGIMLLAKDPHGGEHLTNLLVGQILWTDWETLAQQGIIFAALFLLWWTKFRHSQLGFYLIFAVTVTLAVQLVGVYLIFASLILPALAIANRPNALHWGYVVGIVGYALGLTLSAIADLPSGAVIVWTLALSALLVGLKLKHS